MRDFFPLKTNDSYCDFLSQQVREKKAWGNALCDMDRELQKGTFAHLLKWEVSGLGSQDP